MARRKKANPRGDAVARALAILGEHSDAVVIIMATTRDDRTEGSVLPIVKFDGDMGACYGVLCLAYEHAEECGLTVPDEDDDDDEGADK